MKPLPKVLVIVGLTASGKTKLAVALARRFDGEIIAADSRQVYRGMDIGTGKDLDAYGIKTKSAKRKVQNNRVAYHLIDVASPRGQFTVARYQQLAYRRIEDILRRGKLPIICGGTGLYVDAVVKGYRLPELRIANYELRKIRQRMRRFTMAQLLTRLKRVDPETFRAIDQKNRRRIERALEIYYSTGNPKSAQLVMTLPPYDFLLLGVNVPRRVLHQRIARRLRFRLRSGLLPEVRRLHRMGVSWRRLDAFGLEYQWVSRYLRGKMNRLTMETQLLRDIKRFARRQMTWFRRNRNIVWVTDWPPARRLVARWLSPPPAVDGRGA